MTIARTVRLTAAFLFVIFPTLTVDAQTLPGETGSKGVRILRPDVAAQQETTVATPTAPAPSPTPAPTPKPKPPPPPQKVVIPVIQPCARPKAAPDIKLPIGNFDAVLAGKLKTGKPVVVDLDKPFPQRDAAPAPLDRWLTEVKAGGGTVEVRQYCDGARGMFGNWLAKLFGAPNPAGKLYRSARNYDALLHADALDRVVTQIEFTPKTARPKP